jgi:hypothetical protein
VLAVAGVALKAVKLLIYLTDLFAQRQARQQVFRTLFRGKRTVFKFFFHFYCPLH